MIRLATIAVCLLTYVSAFKFDDIPEDYRDLVPKEARFFLAGLSDSDKATLREIHQNIGMFRSEDEVLAAIKQRNPGLGSKVETFYNMMRNKLAALGPEAQPFAREMVNIARNFRVQYFAGYRPTRAELKQAALYVIGRYNAMSPAGKADFQMQFPILSKIFRSKRVLRRLQSIN